MSLVTRFASLFVDEGSNLGIHILDCNLTAGEWPEKDGI